MTDSVSKSIDLLPAPLNLRSKGMRWLRALHRQTEATWHAQMEGIEAVAIEAAFAVIAVRILDLEVFRAAHGRRYETVRDNCDGGRTVSGLTLIRNAEVHLPVALEPDFEYRPGCISRRPERGGTNSTVERRHIWATRWKSYSELPDSVRHSERTAERCHTAYRDMVEREEVVETLLEAIAFFDQLDPSIVPRSATGQLAHLPLTALLGLHDTYRRLHPSEPRRRDVARRLIEKTRSRRPPGTRRVILYEVRSASGVLLAYAGFGYGHPNTMIGGEYGKCSWVDSGGQVVRDIEMGFPYDVGVVTGEQGIAVESGRLRVDGALLDDLHLPQPPARPDWWLIKYRWLGDPFAYALERGILWQDDEELVAALDG